MTNFSLYDINKIVDADYIDFASTKANGATVKTSSGKTLNCRGETAPCGNSCRKPANCKGGGTTSKSASKSLNKAVGGITGLTDKSTLVEVRDDSKPITMDTGETKKKAKDVTEGRTITDGSPAERDEKIAAVQAAKEKKKAGAAKVTEREAVNPGDGKFKPRYKKGANDQDQDYVKSDEEKAIEKEERKPSRRKGTGDFEARKKRAEKTVEKRAERGIADEPGMRAQDKITKQKQMDDKAIVEDLKQARLDKQQSFISTEERAAKRKAELAAKAKETAERKRKQKEVGDKPDLASGDKAEQARKVREANKELEAQRQANIVEESTKQQVKLTPEERKRFAATNAIRKRNGLEPLTESTYRDNLREANKTRVAAGMQAPPDKRNDSAPTSEAKQTDIAKRRRELMDKKLDREERMGSSRSDETEKEAIGKKVDKQVLRAVPAARKEGQTQEDYDDKVFVWKARKAEELSKAYANEGVQLPYVEAMKIVNGHMKKTRATKSNLSDEAEKQIKNFKTLFGDKPSAPTAKDAEKQRTSLNNLQKSHSADLAKWEQQMYKQIKQAYSQQGIELSDAEINTKVANL